MSTELTQTTAQLTELCEQVDASMWLASDVQGGALQLDHIDSGHGPRSLLSNCGELFRAQRQQRACDEAYENDHKKKPLQSHSYREHSWGW